MNEMKEAMRAYFPKYLNFLKTKFDESYPSIYVPEGQESFLIISERDESGWSKWLPVEKNVTTDFNYIEQKYSHNLHKDIKDYYNQFWFYKLFGNIYIDKHMGTNMIQLERVVPDYEIHDLDAHIERYYRGGDINNFKMIPIGFVQNIFVVVDNNTGEVFVDDRLEFGIFRKVADNLAELINKMDLDVNLT